MSNKLKSFYPQYVIADNKNPAFINETYGCDITISLLYRDDNDEPIPLNTSVYVEVTMLHNTIDLLKDQDVLQILDAKKGMAQINLAQSFVTENMLPDVKYPIMLYIYESVTDRCIDNITFYLTLFKRVFLNE